MDMLKVKLSPAQGRRKIAFFKMISCLLADEIFFCQLQKCILLADEIFLASKLIFFLLADEIFGGFQPADTDGLGTE